MTSKQVGIQASDIPGFNINHLLQQLGYLKQAKQTRRDIGTGTARFKQHDNRTIANLQHAQFSGIRANELWLRFEIWILGRVEKTISYQEFFLDTGILERAYCEVFGLDKINFDAKTQREMRLLNERKSLLSEPEVQKALERLEDKSTAKGEDTEGSKS